jgi:hypothetical protein
MSEGSALDMNALLRGEVRQDPDSEQAASDEVASIGGKSDAGAGERQQPRTRDMNAWLRDAVSESRGRPT